MKSLDQIATEMRMTQARLIQFGPSGGRGIQAELLIMARREFVLKAFGAGHDQEAIGAFIQRSPVMVLHALRMGCMERAGGDYGRTLKQLADELRRVAA